MVDQVLMLITLLILLDVRRLLIAGVTWGVANPQSKVMRTECNPSPGPTPFSARKAASRSS